MKESLSKSNSPNASRDSLRAFTTARVALDTTGCSETTTTSLAFKLAHAAAKDALNHEMNTDKLQTFLKDNNISYLQLQSAVDNKATFLQRPDLGRKLSEASKSLLESNTFPESDVCIVVSDGLSSLAVNDQFPALLLPLLQELQHAGLSFSPICITPLSRVAIADEIGSLLKAKVSLILIGERPGLSSPNSLGAYITYLPKVGNTDEKRNCISNIRPEGISPKEAAAKICYLIQSALRLQLSGVNLKDDFGMGMIR